MARRLTLGGGDEESQEIDRATFLVPCQRFFIRAWLTEDKQLPLVNEFALRLVRAVGAISSEDLRGFFGFTAKQMQVVVSDLCRGELLVAGAEGMLRLSRNGEEAFQYGTITQPRIVAVEELRDTADFDLIAFCLAAERAIGPHLAVLGELPKPDAAKASRSAQVVRDAFQRHFREYQDRRRRDHDERDEGAPPSIYAMDEVEPRRRFQSELVVPLRLRWQPRPRLEPDFSALHSLGRPGSRDALIAEAARRLELIQAPSGGREALELLRTFDQGYLSRFVIGDAFHNVDWLRFAMRARRTTGHAGTKSPTRLVFGTSQSTPVRDELLQWAWSGPFPQRERPSPIIWLKPGTAHWGLGTEFVTAASNLARKAGESGGEPSIILLAYLEEGARTGALLRRAYSRTFAYGVALQQPGLPAALEIVLDPAHWVLVLVHLPFNEQGYPLPVGFLSREEGLVHGVQDLLRSQLLPGRRGDVLWPTDDEGGLVALERVLATPRIEQAQP